MSPLVQAQTLGISESFSLHIDEPYQAGDYLYHFGGIDDVWLGLWGILRAYAQPQETCRRCAVRSPGFRVWRRLPVR